MSAAGPNGTWLGLGKIYAIRLHETRGTRRRCLDVSVLKGATVAVRGLADELTAQRGVRHANLHVVPVKVSNVRHDHGSGTATHPHFHA